MLKLFTIAAGFTFVLSLIAVLAHDSIARLERREIERELHAIKTRPMQLSQIQQSFKKLAGYKIWLPPLQSQAGTEDMCKQMQDRLESLATGENWEIWNITWIEFTSSQCL